MDTYIISLNNPIKLIEDLKIKGLNPILFNGINGRYIGKNVIENHVSSFWGKFGPKSAIGCGLSHLFVWNEFIKSGKSECIVFEDDIIYKKDLDIKLEIKNALKNVPKNYDILYLGSISGDFFTYTLPFISNTQKKINDKIEIPSVALATHAYIISKKGAKKLIKLMYNKKYIFQHIDFCLQYLASKKLLKSYITTPRIIYQSSTNNIETSSNSTNNHPIILHTLLSKMHVDKFVRANYISTVSCFRLGKINITLITFIISLLGIYFKKSNIYWLSIIFVLISIPDKMSINVLFHYLLFVTPSCLLSLSFLL